MFYFQTPLIQPSGDLRYMLHCFRRCEMLAGLSIGQRFSGLLMAHLADSFWSTPIWSCWGFDPRLSWPFLVYLANQGQDKQVLTWICFVVGIERAHTVTMIWSSGIVSLAVNGRTLQGDWALHPSNRKTPHAHMDQVALRAGELYPFANLFR